MTGAALAWFNTAGGEAQDALLACADVPRWATGVLERRPYSDVTALLETADTLARSFTDAEVESALAAHPRIGECSSGDGAGAAFSRREQAAALSSLDDTGDGDTEDRASGADALVEVNRAYEQRFGRVFLICASGRSAADIVAEGWRRLGNDDGTERGEVADELRRITLLRLRSLADAAPDGTHGVAS